MSSKDKKTPSTISKTHEKTTSQRSTANDQNDPTLSTNLHLNRSSKASEQRSFLDMHRQNQELKAMLSECNTTLQRCIAELDKSLAEKEKKRRK
ncbi:hypothetical protein BO86DRAFT_395583 [Aspergillus japonicus CBS 114.51]|uniref:Uncharacterized protein n=2 Tax=Aspergillus TaxID=5052 RepID=A0A2V5HJL7_ASPV1|nr:hypothetical protein BO86DRAFT_395583 [Aspergillus japonicus CBS 114.51]PYI22702.1 hypothetical protein BO99DRAFT_399797 [Aspergillus violaceofuscus CBS 115571]RAH86137.1 hypothetical protein BO86DRAFT_395583 [Aspergillus japonicus CBS 114.51]